MAEPVVTAPRGLMQLNQILNGFLFGTGLILASALMKAVLHMGFCG